jgi:hypothetical protein
MRGEKQMAKKEITVKVTLNLDDKWASNQDKDELLEAIRKRMDYSLGFRGRIKKFKLVAR